VAVALYAAGVSQRKAAEVMSFLLGHRYSHETISAMTEEVLQAVEAFRRRPLPEEMAFVYLDGLYLKLLREGEGVVREVVYVALGVTPSGERRVLGYWLLPAESALGWEGKTFLSQPFSKGACDLCLPAAANALHRDEQTLRQDASSKSVLTKTALSFCQWRRRKHEKHVHRHSWQQ
jgi:hypothetical protein